MILAPMIASFAPLHISGALVVSAGNSRDAVLAPMSGCTVARLSRGIDNPPAPGARGDGRKVRVMRIAIMAAGAVGAYFGGRMAAAGHDVTFIARGAHRDAIRREGLRIESTLGDLHLKNVNVTDDTKQVGPVELVLFAVKLWDTEASADRLVLLSVLTLA
jgi:hypothetical protein